MINKWILNNFKSIESREDLEFRPLTIFTGANSSGKSTVLQSVMRVC
ncbi:MAG: AAA family ATPase [Candidatus Onthomorpha sp.]